MLDKKYNHITVGLAAVVLIPVAFIIWQTSSANRDPFNRMLDESVHANPQSERDFVSLMRIIERMGRRDFSNADDHLNTVVTLLDSEDPKIRSLARSALRGFSKADNRNDALKVVRQLDETEIGDSVAKFGLLQSFGQPEWRTMAQDCVAKNDPDWSDFCQKVLIRDELTASTRPTD